MTHFICERFNNMNSDIWVKVFKNGPSQICGRQTLKCLKWYGYVWSQEQIHPSWEKNLFGTCPRAQFLELFFNVLMLDYFQFQVTEFATYANYDTPYVIGRNAKKAIESSEIFFYQLN